MIKYIALYSCFISVPLSRQTKSFSRKKQTFTNNSAVKCLPNDFVFLKIGDKITLIMHTKAPDVKCGINNI